MGFARGLQDFCVNTEQQYNDDTNSCSAVRPSLARVALLLGGALLPLDLQPGHERVSCPSAAAARFGKAPRVCRFAFSL